MEQNSFQDYYNDVKQRDQQILENTPLPEARGTSVWSIFGLTLGIASVVCFFIPKIAIFIGLIALGCSVMGYIKKNENVALAGIICSAIGLIVSISIIIGNMMSNTP